MKHNSELCYDAMMELQKNRDDRIRKYAQEIAKGVCHHTTIGEVRTLEVILGEVFDAGVASVSGSDAGIGT